MTAIPANAQVIDFSAVFNNYIAANQKTWEFDRSLTLGASETFDCIRKAWFGKRGKEFGFKPDEGVEDWGAMERGNLIENYYVCEGMKHLPPPLNLLFGGADQKTLVVNRNSATPDGLIAGLDPTRPLVIYGAAGGMRVEEPIIIEDLGADCVCFEIKSIDPRANLLEERQKHHGQTQIQIATFNEKTPWKPKYSIILYIDCSFLSKMTPFVVKFEEDKWSAAQFRANAIWEHDDPLMFVGEGKWDGSCDYCKFKTACGEAVVSRVKQMNEAVIDPTIITGLTPLVDKHFELKKAAADAEAALKHHDERVREYLLDNNTRKASTNLWGISWSTVKGKKSLDTEALAKSGLDLKKFEKVGAEFERLSITLKKKKSE